MENLLPKQLFTENYELTGNFSRNCTVVDKIQLLIQFPSTKPGDIKGKIIGNAADVERFINLMQGNSPYVELNAKTHTGEQEFLSKRVIMHNLTQHYPRYSDGQKYVVADLEFQDLTTITRFPASDLKERYLTFFLKGPRDIWLVYSIRGRSYTGEVENKISNTEIDLNTGFPFEIRVTPRYFYDTMPPPNNYEVSTDILTLELKTSQGKEQLSDDDFIKIGKEIVDDLTLLASFLSGQWILWYRYQFQDEERIENYIKRTREYPGKDSNLDDSFVDRVGIREFLKVALGNFRKYKSEGFNLYMPLVYFIAGNEGRTVEEKFSKLFLSLEKIKDMFAIRENLLVNLPLDEFDKLKSKISEVITGEALDKIISGKINAKLPELNRPTLRVVLDAIFEKHGISWDDLYPKGGDLSIVKTRNSLFHSSEDIDLSLLAKETERLKIILARILLRMLGWQDISHSQSRYTLEWLRSS